MHTVSSTEPMAFESSRSAWIETIKRVMLWLGFMLLGLALGGSLAAVLRHTPIPITHAAAAWTGTSTLLFLGFGLSAASLGTALLHTLFGATLFAMAFALQQGAYLHPATAFIVQAAWTSAHLANEAESERYPLLVIWAAANMLLALDLLRAG